MRWIILHCQLACQGVCGFMHAKTRRWSNLEVVKSRAVEGNKSGEVGSGGGAGDGLAAGKLAEAAKGQHTPVQQHLLQVPPGKAQRQQRCLIFLLAVRHRLCAFLHSLTPRHSNRAYRRTMYVRSSFLLVEFLKLRE